MRHATYNRTSVLFFAVNGCQARLKEVYDILDPLVSARSRMQRLWVRLKWPQEKEGAADIVLALHRYAQIFHFAVDLDGLDALSKFQSEALEDIQKRLVSMEETQNAAVQARFQETLASIQSLPDMSADIAKLREDMEKVVLDKEFSHYLNVVPALPYQERHRDLQLRRMGGVGLWVLDTPQFLSWRDGTSKSNILWLNGGPGVGKTYISSSIIDHLSGFGTQTSHTTVFFYFEYKQQVEEDPLKVLQTLFHQLLAKSLSIPTHISARLSDAAKLKEFLSWDELKAAFIKLCDASSTIYLVFDALDECEERNNRAPVIQFLNDLKTSKARILVTSRQFAPDIDSLLKDCDKITVEAAASDIRAYLVDQIARSPRAVRLMDWPLRETVVNDIMSKSQGMFLLPALQIAHILGQTNRQEILQALKRLPRGLKANFDLTLARIQSQDAQSNTRANLGLSVLMWLTYAKEQFTTKKLQQAIAVDSNESTMRDLTDIAFFVDCCFGLVVIDEGTNVIRLVHQSVHEYLLSNEELLFPDGHAIVARSCLSYYTQNSSHIDGIQAQSCVWPFFWYATTFFLVHATDATSKQTALVEDIRQSFAAPQSVDVWVDALQRCAALEVLDLAGSWPTEDLDAMLNTGSTLLQLAIAYGAEALAKDLLDSPGTDPNTRDSGGITLLMAAAAWGRGFALDHLLASEDLRINLTDSKGWTALDWAVRRGQDAMVEAILNSAHAVNIPLHGSNPSSIESMLYGVPSEQGMLQKFLGYKHFDMHAKFEGNGDKGTFNLWLKVAWLWTPLTLQALIKCPGFDPWIWGCPRRGVLTLLSEAEGMDYDIDYPEDLRLGPMDDEIRRQRIIRFASVPAVLSMLDADPRFDPPRFSILRMLWPFVYYAFCEDLPVPKVSTVDHLEYAFGWMKIRDTPSGALRAEIRATLQSWNVSFRYRDSAGRGFIHYFASSGDEQRLDFLLSLGPSSAEDALRPDHNGLTPLHFAARAGHEYTARALLYLGADIFVTDHDGLTALHHAVEGGYLRTAQLLLRRAHNNHKDWPPHNLTDNFGRSLLHKAVRSPNPEVMIPLCLGIGLDVNAGDSTGFTPSHLAIALGDSTALRLLLENGANPDQKTFLGLSVLSFALHYGGSSLLLLLRQSRMRAEDCNFFGQNLLEAIHDTHNYAREIPLVLASQSRDSAPSPTHDEKGKRKYRAKLVLTCLRLFLSLGTKTLPHVAFILAVILSWQGDKISAQIVFETFADERSKLSPRPHFGTVGNYQMACRACQTFTDCLSICETCYRLVLCSKCRANPPESLLKTATLLSCGQHRYLQFPRGEWSSVPAGFVTTEGLTWMEWLKEQEAKYTKIVERGWY